MQGALVILGVLIAVGLLIFYADRRKPHSHHAATSPSEPEKSEKKQEVCCGMHAICEKNLSTLSTETPLYYDDEELDLLANRNPAEYTEAEIEQLRDVLLTLRREDAAGWSRSLEQRHIALPPDLRDELLLLLSQD